MHGLDIWFGLCPRTFVLTFIIALLWLMMCKSSTNVLLKGFYCDAVTGSATFLFCLFFIEISQGNSDKKAKQQPQ